MQLFIHPANRTIAPRTVWRRLGMAGAFMLLQLFTLQLLTAQGAHAQTPAAATTTFQVNSLADPGDGVCNAGECTLREALNAANVAAGPDRITFAAGLSGNIQLTNILSISDDVILQVQSRSKLSITAEQTVKLGVFAIGAAAPITVTIRGVTIQGAIGGVSAVQNANGVLTLEDSTLRDNDVNGSGGAIVNQAAGTPRCVTARSATTWLYKAAASTIWANSPSSAAPLAAIIPMASPVQGLRFTIRAAPW